MTTWAATIRDRDGLVEVRVTREHPPVQMCPEVARRIAATLLVVAEMAEGGDTGEARGTSEAGP
jgi:hypothetical protein